MATDSMLNGVKLGRLIWIFFGSALMFSVSPMMAQEPDSSSVAQSQAVSFDHLNGVETAYTLHLDDDEEFRIRITNACPDGFRIRRFAASLAMCLKTRERRRPPDS